MENRLNNILKDLSQYEEKDREQLLTQFIKERLDKSLETYSKTLDEAYESALNYNAYYNLKLAKKIYKEK